MKTGQTTISGIETLTVLGEKASTAVIFLHGYGANMHDLFPLWEMWHQEKFDWYFPNGIQSLPMGYYGGRCWFSIDIAALEEAMRTGAHRDMAQHIPPELDVTLEKLESFISEVAGEHQQLVLGGFSQGAMLASHLAMRQSLKLDGLILLSGALAASPRIPAKASGIPFYQSHGSADPILSVAGAHALEQKLQSLEFQGELKVFPGGHEIPPSVINDVKKFLQQFV